ncbi:MAG: hypothetical protein WCX97_03175 [Candidatus Magasanikbacteria bacterium]
MTNSKLIFWGFVHAMGVDLYITIVAIIIRYGEQIFGKMNNLFGPMAFLMLFVLSAAITSALVLGRPILLYMEGKKIEAIKLFGYILGWLFILTTLTLAIATFI